METVYQSHHYLSYTSTTNKAWHKVNFKRSIAGLNSELFFSQMTGCLTEAKETWLFYYLSIAEGSTDSFMFSRRALALSEMQSRPVELSMPIPLPVTIISIL